MRMISVIVPCFNEREVLPAMYAELERVRKEDFCGSDISLQMTEKHGII